MDPAETPVPRPLLRVVSGDPGPEELAALVAVLTARPAAESEPPQAPGSRWLSRTAGLRQPLRPGPGAWRASAWLPGTRTRAGF